jgi:cyclopropane fatty-acyl-phospholipid synthase-like methyltransferase
MERADVLRAGRVYQKRVLDVGAGALAVIAARDFGCRVFTIDVLADAVRSARARAAEADVADQIVCQQADGTALPYRDDSFEVAVSYGTLHHIPVAKRADYLDELFRTTTQTVIIADFTPEGFAEIHGESTHERADLDWVAKRLAEEGQTQVHTSDRMAAYVCRHGD